MHPPRGRSPRRAPQTASRTCKASGKRTTARPSTCSITSRASACRPAKASSSAATKFRTSRRRSSRSARTTQTARSADPLAQCYLPGVPRIMYMEYPFQIFQTAEHVAITFEWSQVYRLIYTNGKPTLHEGIESWMGNSRGRWEGDTLVVEVTDYNDRTWLDAAGNFHSNALKVTERYSLRDANTIDYEVTFDDPQTFTRPWKIAMQLHRQTDCHADLRISVPSRGRGSERRLRARRTHLVSRDSTGRQRIVRCARERGPARAHGAARHCAPARRQTGPHRLVPAGRGRRELRARDAPQSIS